MFLAPLIIGVGIHLLQLPFEIDRYLFSIIAAGVSAFAVVFASLHHYGGHSIAGAVSQTLDINATFAAGFFASTLIYRVFFHRLHRFPGPFLAKVSRFHALRIAAATLQSHVEADKAHEKYGDFVRVGMSAVGSRAAAAAVVPPPIWR